MQALEECWQNRDGNLPFDPNVDHDALFARLRDVRRQGCLDACTKARVLQWMQFDGAIAAANGEPTACYARFRRLLDDAPQSQAVVVYAESALPPRVIHTGIGVVGDDF